MMKKILVIGLGILLLGCLINNAHALKARWFTALTGGGDGALDSVDGNDLSDGDMGIVILDNSGVYEIYFYRLEDTAATENPPLVIAPDTNPGNKRWRLAHIYTTGLTLSGFGTGLLYSTAGAVSSTTTLSGIGISGLTASRMLKSDVSGNLTTSKWTFDDPTTLATIKAGGDNKTYTMPADSDTLVGRNSTDTLTNKIMDMSSNTLREMPINKDFHIINPKNGDVALYKAQRDAKVTNIGCIVDPSDSSESVVVDVKECDSNGDSCASLLQSTITCGNTSTTGTLVASPDIDANDWIQVSVGTVSGTVSNLSIYIWETETW